MMLCKISARPALTSTTSVAVARGCRAISTKSTETNSQSAANRKERVVILGSGWAGFSLARSLPSKTTQRILISPRSYFAFTPLLASTSVGTLEFRAALEPVRRLGLDEFHQAWASSIDFQRKVVRVEASVGDANDGSHHTSVSRNTSLDKNKITETKNVACFDVEYDKLIIAVGCWSQTFGIEGVKEHACFLKDVGDARNIRLRVLQAFEKAALPTTDEEERRKLLHFAIVGGGPTGIEFAAELHDLIHEDLSRLYPPWLMKHVSITIYDIAPKVLPMFDQKLADYATALFRRQGIEIKTNRSLQKIRREGDHLVLTIKEDTSEVGAGVVVWSTGLMQGPLVKGLLAKEIDGVGRIAQDARTGGIVTDNHMRVQVYENSDSSDGSTATRVLPDVHAIGDCASIQGARYPATAQVASQQAAYLAKALRSGQHKATGAEGKPFRFRNWGTMAYLGGWRAIHQSQADELTGRAAWLLWRTAYLTKSMSMRNKVMIPVYWLITWIFGRDISRF